MKINHRLISCAVVPVAIVFLSSCSSTQASLVDPLAHERGEPVQIPGQWPRNFDHEKLRIPAILGTENRSSPSLSPSDVALHNAIFTARIANRESWLYPSYTGTPI